MTYISLWRFTVGRWTCYSRGHELASFFLKRRFKCHVYCVKSTFTVYTPSAPFLSATARLRWTEAVDVWSDVVVWQELDASRSEAVYIDEPSVYSHIEFSPRKLVQ